MKDFKGKQKTPGSMLKGCSYARGGKVSKVDRALKVDATKAKTLTENKEEEEIGRVGGEAPAKRMDKKERGEYKSGGAVMKEKPVPKMDAGAGGGLGRLEKAKSAKKIK